MTLPDHHQDLFYTNDYRTYLINQNRHPITHEKEGGHFRQRGALTGAIVSRVISWGRVVYHAIYNAKMRRLRLKFMWYSIPYSHLLEAYKTSRNAASDENESRR